jgi:hypothetical protein
LLNEHTLDQLRGLRLDGMVHAMSDQASSAAAAGLAFDERLAMLVQREVDWRDGKRLTRLLKAAKLKVSSACIEDIDWRASRGLDRTLVTALAGGDWLRHAHNVLITGATGVGKTWLACALAQQAARNQRRETPAPSVARLQSRLGQQRVTGGQHSYLVGPQQRLQRAGGGGFGCLGQADGQPAESGGRVASPASRCKPGPLTVMAPTENRLTWVQVRSIRYGYPPKDRIGGPKRSA